MKYVGILQPIVSIYKCKLDIAHISIATKVGQAGQLLVNHDELVTLS